MKDIELYIPKLEDYWYEQKLQCDPLTMNYNAGYNVNYFGYHYDTGCIDFPKEKWNETYNKRIKEKRFFAYIKDNKLDKYVGYVNYQFNKNDNRYDCGIVIESKYRGKGYSKSALKLLCEAARNNNVKELYDNFEIDRSNALKVFKSVGFEIVENQTWTKFDKEVCGVLVKINLKEESMIDIKENVYNVEEFNYLFDAVGWGHHDENISRIALENTMYSVSVYDDKKIIAYGRLIGDGVCYIYIHDIMVIPEYQSKKIGATIMNKLLQKIDEIKKQNPDVRVYLGASKGKEGFYEKFGFISRKDAGLGDGMILK